MYHLCSCNSLPTTWCDDINADDARLTDSVGSLIFSLAAPHSCYRGSSKAGNVSFSSLETWIAVPFARLRRLDWVKWYLGVDVDVIASIGFLLQLHLSPAPQIANINSTNPSNYRLNSNPVILASIIFLIQRRNIKPSQHAEGLDQYQYASLYYASRGVERKLRSEHPAFLLPARPNYIFLYSLLNPIATGCG